MARVPAYDDLMQGAALIAGLNAQVNGGEPRYVPLAMADRITGLMAASAINAALVHQLRSGEGQLVEVPMFETMLNFVLGDHLGGKVFDPPLDGGGYGRLLSPDRKPYRTKDGFVCTMIYNDRQWRQSSAPRSAGPTWSRPTRASPAMRRAPCISTRCWGCWRRSS